LGVVEFAGARLADTQERVPSRCSDPAAQSVGENEDYLASPECSQH
jgi:hypothetical protein